MKTFSYGNESLLADFVIYSYSFINTGGKNSVPES